MDAAFLIVGAGPFGLAMAAHAQALGIDYLLIGQPMSFWKRHMPKGMLLRSACDWHFDPSGGDTIERFLATGGLAPSDVEGRPHGLPSLAELYQNRRDKGPEARHW